MVNFTLKGGDIVPKSTKEFDLIVYNLLKSIRDYGNYNILKDKYSTAQLDDAIEYAVTHNLITGLSIVGRNELGQLFINLTSNVRNTRDGLSFIENFIE